jgi:hypothetical protein
MRAGVLRAATPAEAARRLCPLAGGACRAEACMGWQIAETEQQYIAVTRGRAPAGGGWTAVNSDYGGVSLWKRVRPGPRRGFCGFATLQRPDASPAPEPWEGRTVKDAVDGAGRAATTRPRARARRPARR